ncbi:MAG: PAS domain S-box protein [Bacteroidota bacterium]|nr:PAS domain S-box protein [Bacteroidota bacterium]
MKINSYTENAVKFIALLGFTIFLFLFFAYNNLKITRSSSGREANTLAVMEHIEKLQNTLTDIDILVTDMLASNGKDYTRQFHAYETILKNETNAISQLSISLKVPDTLIAAFNGAIVERLSFVGLLFDKAKNNQLKDVYAELNAGKGIITRMHARTDINKINTFCRLQLIELKNNRTEHASNTKSYFILIGILAFLMIAHGIYKISKDAQHKADLAATNQQLAEIFLKSQDPIFVTDTNFKVIDCNKSAEATYGHDKTDILGKDIKDVIYSDSMNKLRESYREILPQKGHYTCEVEVILPSGQLRREILTISSIRDTQNKVTGYFGIHKDITELHTVKEELKVYNQTLQQKVKEQTLHLQEQNARLTALYQSLPNYLVELDENGIIISLNKTKSDRHPHQVVGQPLTNFTLPEYKEVIEKNIRFIMQGGQNSSAEYVLFSENGQKILLSGYFSAIEYDQKRAVLLTAVDITESRKAEEESARLTEIINNSMSCTSIAKIDGTIIYQNKVFRKIMGLAENVNLSDYKLWDFCKPERHSFTEAIVQEVLSKGTWTGENTLVNSKGEEIPVMQAMMLHKNALGEPEYLSMKCIDLTELKNTQKKIEEERLFSDSIVNNLPGIFYMYNMEDGFIKWNKNFEIVTGYTTDEIIRMSPLDFYSDNRKDFVKNRVQQVLEDGNAPKEAEIWILAKHGKEIPFLVNSMAIIHNQKKYMIGIGIDLTENKKSQEEIERLAAIIESSPMYIGMINMENKVVFMNKAARDVLGVAIDEDITTLHAPVFFSPEDQKFDEDILSELWQNGTWIGENFLYSRDGKEIPILQVLYLHKDVNGNPLFISLAAIDLTESKQKQQEIDKLANVIENSIALVAMSDLEKHPIYFNTSFRKALEVPSETAITQYIASDFYSEKGKQIIELAFEEIQRTGFWQGENEMQSLTGKKIPVIQSIMLHKDAKGKPLYNSATIIDITDLKAKEEETERLLKIINMSSAYFAVTDLNGKMIFANDATKSVLGIADHENINDLNFSEFRTAEGNKIIQEARAILLQDGQWLGENYYRSRDGNYIPTLQALILHRDDKGNPAYISATAIDLTAQKKAEEELKKSNTELLELYNRLQEIREEERSEIAREIHDELGQHLTILKITAGAIKKSIGEENPELHEKLNTLAESAQTTIDISRRLLNTLHPNMLDDIGLIATLHWHAKTYSKSTGIAVSINATPIHLNFSKTINLCVYRIFQESLTNVLRYAKTQEVYVNLLWQDQTLHLHIYDNGAGFDTTKVDTMKRHGLAGMRERVAAVQGTIAIQSAVGAGTSIKITIPNALQADIANRI